MNGPVLGDGDLPSPFCWRLVILLCKCPLMEWAQEF